MPGILGTKIGMTRIINDDGHVVPVTVVQCSPNVVVRTKTTEKDGYDAMVIGFDELKKPKKTKKFATLKEFAIAEGDDVKAGDKIDVSKLEEVETVTITGVSKGKGFQGTIKRYNFSRGPETHGSHHHREPGSIGACAKPGRVAKGKKLPGRMGTDTVTKKNVPVVHIDKDKNLVCVKGPVPGGNGSTVTITF